MIWSSRERARKASTTRSAMRRSRARSAASAAAASSDGAASAARATGRRDGGEREGRGRERRDRGGRRGRDARRVVVVLARVAAVATRARTRSPTRLVERRLRAHSDGRSRGRRPARASAQRPPDGESPRARGRRRAWRRTHRRPVSATPSEAGSDEMRHRHVTVPVSRFRTSDLSILSTRTVVRGLNCTWVHALSISMVCSADHRLDYFLLTGLSRPSEGRSARRTPRRAWSTALGIDGRLRVPFARPPNSQVRGRRDGNVSRGRAPRE